MLLWKVGNAPPHDPTASNPNLEFVGAFCGWYAGRLRVAIAGSSALYLLGDFGGFGLPYEVCATEHAPGGCCVLQPSSN